MVKVVWTQRAINDMEDIGDYISKDSIKYAEFILGNIVDTASLISSNPLLGRIVPESNDKTVREIIKGNYRVIYQIRDDNSAYILTIFHGARLFSESELK